MKELKKLFSIKETENGDIAYNTTGDNLLDILFMSQYYRKHLDEVVIGNSDKEKLFSMFMRDPRFGIGERDLGRKLMQLSEVDFNNILLCGRADDFLNMSDNHLDFFVNLLIEGNYYAKKWSPRLSSGKKSRELAFKIMKKLNIKPEQYRKLIKCDTTEYRVCNGMKIEDYSKVPSLAFIKHKDTFYKQDEERFSEFMKQVSQGKKEIKVSTTTPYDIFKKCVKFEYCRYVETDKDADILFNALPKVNLGSILPIVDNSGSMYDNSDSQGKAKAIGHYVAKNNTYLPNHIISFSSKPKLIELGNTYEEDMKKLTSYDDVSNTDFGKVMELLSNLKEDVPEYLLVLSDMEFDYGSYYSKERTMKMFKEKGFNTKIIWWNFNDRNKTVPETDDYGNIFLSGYSPQLLKYLESGFDGHKFLDKLLQEYGNNILKSMGE